MRLVREARAGDAAALVDLIGQLAFDVDEDGVRRRIEKLSELGEPVLVAERDGVVVGALDWHVMHTLHRPAPVGRIVMMVVSENDRSQRFGTPLLSEAEARMRLAGCTLAEVTSNLRLERAHAFYERCGYARTSARFGKRL